MRYFNILILILIFSCGKRSELVFRDLSSDLNSGDADTVTFSMLRTKILDAKCLTCHTQLTSPEALGRWVTPGSPERSKLFQFVKSGKMPLGGSPLDSSDLELIRRYIAGPTFVSFEQLNKEVLAPSCVGCHKLMDNPESLSRWIDVNNPTQSKLYLRTDNGTMPLGGSPLGASQQLLILNYIKQFKQ
jgi:hypothetical protein